MVKLRLRRMGKIDAPFYRIVALDSRKKRDGAYLESVGYYDPKTEPLTLKIDIDKAIKWLEVGAQPSDTVRSLLRQSGALEKWHKMKLETQTPAEKKTEKKVAEKVVEPKKTEEKVVKKTATKKVAPKTTKKVAPKKVTKKETAKETEK
ncbi:MAG: 30S ribosomal protein S16 [Candidatus Cloacimonetes bacterium]|jgi:small subunit ribosomal protein S16|nr:30S ribosomal protein S16 [Candidatus Cloacimonadota bacterium]MBT6993356.1 30S ribosomal protein S16 [Candidatus Cloacimonadota bacterium]MBT7470219.1 30S ribosomal protein S16 [Candidatus Cloacimonadota bacterium]